MFTPNEDIVGGRIPWNAEEVMEALEYGHQLRETPQDDWDRKRRRVEVELGGKVQGFEFNPDMFENQMGFWLAQRFSERGYDQQTSMSHMWRFFEITAFLSTHTQRLREERLLRPDEEESGAELLSTELLAVLAEAPYEGVWARGPERDPARTFHVDKVIEEAKRRMSGE